MESAAPAEHPKHLRVISLTTSNFKRIRAAHVAPDPASSIVLIGGEIDHGKSSLLDSMLDVIGGKDASPDVPVRKGMKKSETVLDLGEFTCRVRHTAAGGRELVVEDKDGNPQKRPQDLMDKLTGKVGFDAEDFIRRKPAEQLDILRRIVGIDFEPLEAKKRTLYEQRTGANSTVKTLDTQLAAAPNPTDHPAELIDTTAVLVEIQKAQEHNKGKEPLLARYTEANAANLDAHRSAGDTEARVSRLNAEIKALEAELTSARDNLELAVASQKAASEVVAKTFTEKEKAIEAGKAFVVHDLEPLQAKLAGADTANNKFRQAEARKALAEQLRTAQARATALDNAVQEIDAQKEKMLLDAKFPVPGLSFNESGILFDGIPFEQAASSTKRRVSVAIGAALNPTLRVMVIKDGSLLGTKGLEQVRQLADEFKLQVWIEVVTSSEEERQRCTVVIEDGAVVGAPAVNLDEPAPESPAKGVTTKDPDAPADLFGGLPPQ